MEGLHFAAGPWFTVQEHGSGWQVLDEIWISNGESDTRARIDIRLAFDDDDDIDQRVGPESKQ